MAVTNQQFILSWTNNNGTNCALQSASDLSVPNWQTATDAIPVNFGPLISAAVQNSASTRFFRLAPIPPASDGMAFIPAGWFTLGNKPGGDTDLGVDATDVFVSAFYMDTNLVTLTQWQAVYKYASTHGYHFDHPGAGKAMNHPVEGVNWYDCVKWCNARSQQSGKAPVYFTDAGFTSLYTTGDTDAVYMNRAANGYRLPTEAEWEKAARGGLAEQRFPWGNVISQSLANYDSFTDDYCHQVGADLGPSGYNSSFAIGGYPYTSPSGSFAPNTFGLFDMAGNVFQLCWDWLAVPYGQPTPSDPTGPATGIYRVVRGGSWGHQADYARCGARNEIEPGSGGLTIGFRCVRAANE